MQLSSVFRDSITDHGLSVILLHLWKKWYQNQAFNCFQVHKWSKSIKTKITYMYMYVNCQVIFMMRHSARIWKRLIRLTCRSCSKLVFQEKSYLFRTSLYLAASASAEFFADIALAPMEAVKVRIQTQPGWANTLREGAPKLWAEEGIRGYVDWLLI